ncbi:GIY-YIG nuclease family protein [Sphingobium sp.]|uniref:GIY-YIG nuclease family protein n=1 Tax=Sphingobium sp. TaxID=1912891 RepID=UPI003B3AF450
MAFHAYRLKCSDGSFYAGHADNLELRITSHPQGEASAYTAPRRPLSPVWCEVFGTREHALAAERRVKGWTRAKKQALIDGDWDWLRKLSRHRQNADDS